MGDDEKCVEMPTLAFDSLYRTHEAVVIASVRRYVPDHAVPDVVQEVFLAMWKDDSWRADRGTRGSYLYGVATYKAIDWLRREAAVVARDVRAPIHPTLHHVPEDVACATDDAARVRAAVDALTLAQRDAIVLAYFGGYTYAQVAEALGTPLGTIKSRIRAGLEALKIHLEPLRGDAISGAEIRCRAGAADV